MIPSVTSMHSNSIVLSPVQHYGMACSMCKLWYQTKMGRVTSPGDLSTCKTLFFVLNNETMSMALKKT
jgi:hypothetical protein